MIDNLKEKMNRIEDVMNNNHNRIYLFLDFDGVINLFLPLDEIDSDADLDHLVDEGCMARLNKLCHDYDLKVVLSTSWRFAGFDYCVDYLHENGFDRNIEILGMTQSEELLDRSEEIINYLLDRDDYSNFIVIDDLFMEDLIAHQILCDSYLGYDEDCDSTARALLKTMR